MKKLFLASAAVILIGAGCNKPAPQTEQSEQTFRPPTELPKPTIPSTPPPANGKPGMPIPPDAAILKQ